MKGVLYLVATPIGNINDISFRACEILKLVDKIYAEDTRETGQLLKLLGISNKQLVSYHDHNELAKFDLLKKDLNSGKNIAIVSDRGTPLISDPGYKTIQKLRLEQYKIIPIPGAVAFVNALIASGLPTDKFLFLGFLNYKKDELKKYKDIPATIIFYESPKRVNKLINYLLKELGDRDIVIARELTKKFENFYMGKLNGISETITSIKGECVVLIGPPEKFENNTKKNYQKRVDELINLGIDKKTIEKIIVNDFKIKKNEIYQYIHK